jgi:hypothetical protein
VIIKDLTQKIITSPHSLLLYAARCEEINYSDGIVTKHPLGKGRKGQE